MERGDALLGEVGPLNGSAELLFEVALRVRPLGEDEHTPVVPRGAGLSELGAQIGLDPGDQARDARIGHAAGGVRPFAHLCEQRELARHRRLVRGGGSAGGGRPHLVVLSFGELFVGQIACLVIRTW
ncbi:MAG: hypothetical protein ACREMQ_19215 [Longimicrobiales bacterium]